MQTFLAHHCNKRYNCIYYYNGELRRSASKKIQINYIVYLLRVFFLSILNKVCKYIQLFWFSFFYPYITIKSVFDVKKFCLLTLNNTHYKSFYIYFFFQRIQSYSLLFKHICYDKQMHNNKLYIK